MRVIVCILASISVFAACVGGWWFYWPIWQVQSHVKTRIPEARFAEFSGVTYNKSTGTGCGYVRADDRSGRVSGRTHFILLPDGDVKFDPKDPISGNTLQRLESLRKHTDYLALVYDRCAPPA